MDRSRGQRDGLVHENIYVCANYVNLKIFWSHKTVQQRLSGGLSMERQVICMTLSLPY